MLPLTEGSLRLRADDEDSLTSEDSFFSATEVNRLGDQVGGPGPLGQDWVVCVWGVRLFSWVGMKPCFPNTLKFPGQEA
jgi:hypothetical protein